MKNIILITFLMHSEFYNKVKIWIDLSNGKSKVILPKKLNKITKYIDFDEQNLAILTGKINYLFL